MKTIANNSPALNRSLAFSFYCMALLNLLCFTNVSAQAPITYPEPHQDTRHDPDFPGRKKFNAGLIGTYTGITPPPAVVGDVTYGLSDKVSIGILGGTTGTQSLAGLKFNSTLFYRDNFRVISRMIIIYYPGRDGGEYLFDKSQKFIMPWMLSMAVVDAEWKTSKGIRWSLGMGVMETHCIEGMKQYFWGNAEEEKISPFEVFHTLQGSVSIPVSKKLTFRPEVIAVMKDAQLIPTGQFKVFPINPFLKLIYAF